MEIWRLTIEKRNSNCVMICGTEEVLRHAVDDWMKYEQESAKQWVETEGRGETFRDPGQFQVRTVEGFSDDVSRTPLTVAYRFLDVLGMALVRM